MLRSSVLALASTRVVPRKARWALMRAVGVETDAWNIAAGCLFTGTRISIGRGTFVNTGCMFDTSARITVGARCAFGPQVMVLTSTHGLGTPERRAGELNALPVTIGDGCWIGARATILPGVSIGHGAIIAAGAVVRGDCEPDTLYAGVPARAVRHL